MDTVADALSSGLFAKTALTSIASLPEPVILSPVKTSLTATKEPTMRKEELPPTVDNAGYTEAKPAEWLSGQGKANERTPLLERSTTLCSAPTTALGLGLTSCTAASKGVAVSKYAVTDEAVSTRGATWMYNTSMGKVAVPDLVAPSITILAVTEIDAGP
jgi:hypothetical protein